MRFVSIFTQVKQMNYDKQFFFSEPKNYPKEIQL